MNTQLIQHIDDKIVHINAEKKYHFDLEAEVQENRITVYKVGYIASDRLSKNAFFILEEEDGKTFFHSLLDEAEEEVLCSLLEDDYPFNPRELGMSEFKIPLQNNDVVPFLETHIWRRDLGTMY